MTHNSLVVGQLIANQNASEASLRLADTQRLTIPPDYQAKCAEVDEVLRVSFVHCDSYTTRRIFDVMLLMFRVRANLVKLSIRRAHAADDRLIDEQWATQMHREGRVRLDLVGSLLRAAENNLVVYVETVVAHAHHYASFIPVASVRKTRRVYIHGSTTTIHDANKAVNILRLGSSAPSWVTNSIKAGEFGRVGQMSYLHERYRHHIRLLQTMKLVAREKYAPNKRPKVRLTRETKTTLWSLDHPGQQEDCAAIALKGPRCETPKLVFNNELSSATFSSAPMLPVSSCTDVRNDIDSPSMSMALSGYIAALTPEDPAEDAAGLNHPQISSQKVMALLKGNAHYDATFFEPEAQSLLSDLGRLEASSKKDGENKCASGSLISPRRALSVLLGQNLPKYELES